MNAPIPSLRSTGDLIANRYRVDSLVGRGTFAEVYRAIDEHLGRAVAVKLMAPRVKVGAGQDPDAVFAEIVERFRREAVSNASLNDPNTVTMLDFGQDPTDGSLFMVQEFIDGRSLRDLLKEEGQMAPERVTSILIGALRSLREAHTKGLLHRDIKPENIMIFKAPGERDAVRVVDFGIARATEDGGLTAAGMLVGTPRYMAPERITKSAELAPASDVYSLGVCAYYMLSGEELYPGLNAMQLLRAHVEGEDVKLPNTFAAPQALRDVVEKMLVKDMSARFGAAQPAIEALLPIHYAFELQTSERMSAFDSAISDMSSLDAVHTSRTEIFTAVVNDDPTVMNQPALAPQPPAPATGAWQEPVAPAAPAPSGIPVVVLVLAVVVTLIVSLAIGVGVGFALAGS